MDKARQEILMKLKIASGNKNLQEKPDFNEPVYFPVEGNLAVSFKKNLENVAGEAWIFDSEKELFITLKSIIEGRNLEPVFCAEPAIGEKLRKYDVPFKQGVDFPENIGAGITGCEFLVAHLGSNCELGTGRGEEKFYIPACPYCYCQRIPVGRLPEYCLQQAYEKIQ